MPATEQPIRRFDFVTTKYGDELLVDVGSTDELPGFEFHRTPHQLTFFDVLLLRRGHGRLLQQDRWHAVDPGTVVFHRPGECRRWLLRDVGEGCEGIVLFFTEEFLRSFLRDEGFLRRLSFFAPSGPRTLALEPAERERFDATLESMRRDVLDQPWGHRQALQAKTYDTLVWLDQLCHRQHGPVRCEQSTWFRQFENAVERDFREHRKVGHYAKQCNFSSSHLNALVRSQSGLSVGQFVRQRVVLEARRLLSHTDQTVVEIALACGFEDASYFCRFFRRSVGHSPKEFRRLIRSEQCDRAKAGISE